MKHTPFAAGLACLSWFLTACGPAAPATEGSVAGAPASSSPAAPGEAALDNPCNFPHDASIHVGDAASLGAALASARPGTLIQLAPGTYQGHFTIDASGSESEPIVVCGPRTAVLAAGRLDSGYVLHLDGVDHVVVSGITVTGGKKGVVLDGSRHTLLTGLLIHGVGQEAVQMRHQSSDNVVSYSEIRDTGLSRPGYGDGVSIGTYAGGWDDATGSSETPDRSDRNQVLNNFFGPRIGAEHVDAREGTSAGIIRGNTFDGTGMSNVNGADSWVVVRGNQYRVEHNSGRDAPRDGFQVLATRSGWGRANVFGGNVATVNGPGFGFAIDPDTEDNRVLCDNRVGHAASGYANVACGDDGTPAPEESVGDDAGGEVPPEDAPVEDPDADEGSDENAPDGGDNAGGSDGDTPSEPPVSSPPPTQDDPVDDDLDSSRPPSANFDLRRWYLTLPSGSTVQPSELSNGYSKANVFYTDSQTGGMVFECPNRAGTTTNSKYSRSELREMRAGGGSAKDDSNNWIPAEGGTMRARLRVDRVSTTGDSSKVGRVVVGQIHGVDAEPIRLYFHKKPDEARGRMYGGYDSASNSGTWTPDIVPNGGDGGIALGEVFEYEIRLVDLRLTVVIRSQSGREYRYGYDIDPAYRGENMYFKAGAYNQNNTGESSDYVKVTFFGLSVTHP